MATFTQELSRHASRRFGDGGKVAWRSTRGRSPEVVRDAIRSLNGVPNWSARLSPTGKSVIVTRRKPKSP